MWRESSRHASMSRAHPSFHKPDAKEALAEGMTPSSMLRLRTKGVSEPWALFQNVLDSGSNSRSMAVAMRARASWSHSQSWVD